MSALTSIFWFDLVSMFTAGCFAFIGLVAVKMFHGNQYDSQEDLQDKSIHLLNDPPKLVLGFDDLLLLSTHQIVLKLKNLGGAICLQGISIREYNRSTIQLRGIKETSQIQTDETISIILTDDLHNIPEYHFNVIFTDVHGTTYSQEIRGKGKVQLSVEEALELAV